MAVQSSGQKGSRASSKPRGRVKRPRASVLPGDSGGNETGSTVEQKDVFGLSSRPQKTYREKGSDLLRIVQAINEFSTYSGYPPTLRDLGSMVGINSTSHMRYRLMEAQVAGLVAVQRGIARSIVLTVAGKELLNAH